MGCRTIADAAQRLDCFDARAAELDRATQARDVVIADRAQVREARRGLFGFTAKVGQFLGIGDSDGEQVDAIDTTVREVRRTREGGWKLAFAEGGVWEQTDTRELALSPRSGSRARIEKGVLGSYFVKIDGQAPMRMRRVE